MAIALVMPERATVALKKALQQHLPDTEVDRWPHLHPQRDYPLAIAWQPEANAIASVPGIRGVHSLGAGVDALLADASLPKTLPIARIIDPDLSAQMAEYALMHTLAHKRRLWQFDRQQQQTQWQPALPREIERVGILGLGVIGRAVAAQFLANGFAVHGWARSEHSIPGVTTHHGDDGLQRMFEQCQVLVCVLPLTEATHGLLNDARLAACSDCLLINIARGALLDERALLSALANTHLAHAVLDVFAQEPLPASHPFWTHPAITLTPHIAGLTNPRTASVQIADNYRRLVRGEAMQNLVDRQRGY